MLSFVRAKLLALLLFGGLNTAFGIVARAESADGAVHFELNDSLDDEFVSFMQDPAVSDSDMLPMQPMTNLPSDSRSTSLLDRSSTRLSRLARRRRPYRLTRAPHMFGDWFAAATAFQDTALFGGNIVNASIPLAAGSRRAKVSENNSALTKDRFWIGYNHFHNAQRYQRFNGPTVVGSRDDNVDRLTLGMERTFCDGDWSVELRMPFARRYELNASDLNIEGGSVGDLAIFIKRMLHEWDDLAISAGVGINTPTGSSVQAYMPLTDTRYELQNNAVTIAPFLAVLGVTHDIWFYHGFLQVDIPTNGHEWRVDDAGNISNYVLQEQTLLQLDGGVGVWLHNGGCFPRVTGVAALLEWHYTTTLNDADSFLLPNNRAGLFANPANRYDVSNLTAALHFELEPSCDVRIGIVAPVDRDERFFDTEATIQINKHY